MEEHLNPMAATRLLQHYLRSFCIHQNSQWIYAVFWRVLPRKFPPPKWDSQEGVHEIRSRRNQRNWILAWEDGFCNFAASTAAMNSGDHRGLKPEVFFKMSHEIHNYGEGLIGKVAVDHGHKWIYKDQNNEEKNSSAWLKLLDSHPRNWEAQFQSGVETIALIAVREGVLQLGAVHKINEEVRHVEAVRKKFSYIESIPGILIPRPSSSTRDLNLIQNNSFISNELCCHVNFPFKLAPSMTSLEALLSKLPSVTPPPPLVEAVEEEEEFEEEGMHDGGDGIGGSVPLYNLSLPPPPPSSHFLSS